MGLKTKALDISRSGLKRLGLAPLAIRLIRYLPAKIKKPIKHHWHRGYKLVPEKELEIEYRKALAFLGRNGASGDYLEFGVFYGASLAFVCIAQRKIPFGITSGCLGSTLLRASPKSPQKTPRYGTWAISKRTCRTRSSFSPKLTWT
jgi:hypothetical protein